MYADIYLLGKFIQKAENYHIFPNVACHVEITIKARRNCLIDNGCFPHT